MEAFPVICPGCGELIIVRPQANEAVLSVPAHPDRITPFVACVVSALATTDAGLRMSCRTPRD